MGELNELLERVRSASGPDRELDGEIAKAVREMPSIARYEHENVYGQVVDQWISGGYGGYLFYEPEHCTASVDAALALAEREMPGTWHKLLTEAIGLFGWHEAFHGVKMDPLRDFPRFVVIAFLSAKIAAGATP